MEKHPQKSCCLVEQAMPRRIRTGRMRGFRVKAVDYVKEAKLITPVHIRALASKPSGNVSRYREHAPQGRIGLHVGPRNMKHLFRLVEVARRRQMFVESAFGKG